MWSIPMFLLCLDPFLFKKSPQEITYIYIFFLGTCLSWQVLHWVNIEDTWFHRQTKLELSHSDSLKDETGWVRQEQGRESEREKKCKFKQDRHQGLQSDSAFKSLATVDIVATGLGVGMKNQVERVKCFTPLELCASYIISFSYQCWYVPLLERETEIGLTKQLHANNHSSKTDYTLDTLGVFFWSSNNSLMCPNLKAYV